MTLAHRIAAAIREIRDEDGDTIPEVFGERFLWRVAEVAAEVAAEVSSERVIGEPLADVSRDLVRNLVLRAMSDIHAAMAPIGGPTFGHYADAITDKVFDALGADTPKPPAQE